MIEQTSLSERKSSLDVPQVTLLVILGMETMFFGVLVVSYLFLEDPATPSLWRLQGLAGAALPGLNTLVLLASAWYAGRGLAAIREGKVVNLENCLSLALSLGLLFVAAQLLEFSRLGLPPQTSIRGAAYMALVGFHAAHVLAGVVVLGLILMRTRLGDFSPTRHAAVQVGTWFWYYVTGVWLVLFGVLYFL